MKDPFSEDQAFTAVVNQTVCLESCQDYYENSNKYDKCMGYKEIDRIFNREALKMARLVESGHDEFIRN